tara:strand:- start:801 stop:1481 length:681 start_codon:yes stop_codon:yes gene_type:complete
MKTIAILASGPPKPGRNRHLEIFNGQTCISHVINNCKVENVKISVIISNKNIKLKKYLLDKHKNIIIIETANNSMKTTYEVAFNQDKNDTLIVAGDLWNLKKDNVVKFLNSEYKSALYRLKTPWGKDLFSKDNSLIRRGDIGDSLVLIANKDQKEYLSNENISKAIFYFNKFYPNQKFDINLGNHLWTWLDYVFFFEISSSRYGVNNIETERGSIYIEDLIYLDND